MFGDVGKGTHLKTDLSIPVVGAASAEPREKIIAEIVKLVGPDRGANVHDQHAPRKSHRACMLEDAGRYRAAPPGKHFGGFELIGGRVYAFQQLADRLELPLFRLAIVERRLVEGEQVVFGATAWVELVTGVGKC